MMISPTSRSSGLVGSFHSSQLLSGESSAPAAFHSSNHQLITTLSAKDIVIGMKGRVGSPESYLEIIRRVTQNNNTGSKASRDALVQPVLEEVFKTGHRFLLKSNDNQYKILNINCDKDVIEKRIERSLMRTHSLSLKSEKDNEAQPNSKHKGKRKNKPKLKPGAVPAAAVVASAANPVVAKPGSKDIVVGTKGGTGTSPSYLRIIHEHLTKCTATQSANSLTQRVVKHLLETGHRFVKKQEAGNYKILDIKKDKLAIYSRVYDSLCYNGRKGRDRQKQRELDEEDSDEAEWEEEECEEANLDAKQQARLPDNDIPPIVQQKLPPNSKIIKPACGNKKRKSIMSQGKSDKSEGSLNMPGHFSKVARQQGTSPKGNMPGKFSLDTTCPASKRPYKTSNQEESDSAKGKIQDLDVGSPADRCNYSGTINNYKVNEHGGKVKFNMEYDDGDKELVNLSKRDWYLESAADKGRIPVAASVPATKVNSTITPASQACIQQPSSSTANSNGRLALSRIPVAASVSVTKVNPTITPVSQACIQQPSSSTANSNGRLALSTTDNAGSGSNETNETNGGRGSNNQLRDADEYWMFAIKARESKSPGETLERDLDAFVILPKDCDYAAARKEIQEQLVPDVLSAESTWFFVYSPTRCRMTRKQEARLRVNLKELQEIQGTEMVSFILDVVDPAAST